MEASEAPLGNFMTPLPLSAEGLKRVPHSPGCYIIYLGNQPFYAGMSKQSIRTRLRAHLVGRGSKLVRAMLGEGKAMYFEYYDVYPWENTAPEQVNALEFAFMTMLGDGPLLPGNLRADNYRLFTAGAMDTSRSEDPPVDRFEYTRSIGMRLT